MNQNKITSVDYDEEKQHHVSNVNQDKKTKSKSNAQKAVPILIVAVVSLVIILTCVLIAYYQVYTSGKQNANVLEGVYTSSYYSMVDNLNNLSVDLSKYSTLSTNKAKISTIQDMMLDCNYIIAGLSVLPINEENVVAVTKFFNQVNGLCESYLNVLNEKQNLTQEQELMFDRIGLVVERIKENLNTQNEGMYDTGFNFVDASIFDETGMNELSAGMGDLTNTNIDYPAMVFDGPFSTALETKTVKGLPKEESSKEQAADYLKNVVYKNRDVEVEFIRETNGTIPTYDFSVKLDGKDFEAQITKFGSLLLSLSGYVEGGDPIMGREQGIEMAKTFANNIGFENMDNVWVEENNNIAYINLVSVQDGILLYPDMVKVKVDLTSQEIIGFEAVNYALNHVVRTFEFNASEAEAEELLGFDYNILETNKAIIRLDNGKEIACYEFIVERIDGIYFYYINANNLEISKTMKLVQIKNVEKLI